MSRQDFLGSPAFFGFPFGLAFKDAKKKKEKL